MSKLDPETDALVFQVKDILSRDTRTARATEETDSSDGERSGPGARRFQILLFGNTGSGATHNTSTVSIRPHYNHGVSGVPCPIARRDHVIKYYKNKYLHFLTFTNGNPCVANPL